MTCAPAMKHNCVNCPLMAHENGGITLVELTGRFTLTDAPGVIRGLVGELLAAGRCRILLDLSKVTYLDSAAGVGELVASYVNALQTGAQLRLLDAGKSVRRVLEIAGLCSVLQLFEDKSAAIASF